MAGPFHQPGRQKGISCAISTSAAQLSDRWSGAMLLALAPGRDGGADREPGGHRRLRQRRGERSRTQPDATAANPNPANAVRVAARRTRERRRPQRPGQRQHHYRGGGEHSALGGAPVGVAAGAISSTCTANRRRHHLHRDLDPGEPRHRRAHDSRQPGAEHDAEHPPRSTVILNEQIAGPATGSVTVNALHITLLTGQQGRRLAPRPAARTSRARPSPAARAWSSASAPSARARWACSVSGGTVVGALPARDVRARWRGARRPATALAGPPPAPPRARRARDRPARRVACLAVGAGFLLYTGYRLWDPGARGAQQAMTAKLHREWNEQPVAAAAHRAADRPAVRHDPGSPPSGRPGSFPSSRARRWPSWPPAPAT